MTDGNQYTRDDPKTHDFEWVDARVKCSLSNEFERLKHLVKENCATRRKHQRPEAMVEIAFHEDDDEFRVVREPVPGTHVSTAERICTGAAA